METGFSLSFLFYLICGVFFLFAKNANKRKTRFSIEGTSLLQYEDINWIGWIPHAVVSKVLWQLTEQHLETQELGLFEETSLHESWAKGHGCGSRERILGGSTKGEKKRMSLVRKKWKVLLFLSSTSFPFFLWADGLTHLAPGCKRPALHPPNAYCFLFASVEHHLPFLYYCIFGFPWHSPYISFTEKWQMPT